jgi:hypothetical protein
LTYQDFDRLYLVGNRGFGESYRRTRIRAASPRKTASTDIMNVRFSGSDSFPEEEFDVHEN